MVYRVQLKTMDVHGEVIDMPMNPNIPLSIQPPQIENPLNAMLRVQELRRAQQEEQLNSMRMESAQRQQAQQEQIRNAMVQGRPLEEVARMSGDPTQVSRIMRDTAAAGSSEATALKAKEERSLLEFDRFVHDDASKQAWVNKWANELPEAVGLANIPFSPEMKQKIVMSMKDQLMLGQGERRAAASERVASASERRAQAAQSQYGPDVVASSTTDAQGNVHHFNRHGKEIGVAPGAGKPSTPAKSEEQLRKEARIKAEESRATASQENSAYNIKRIVGNATKIQELLKDDPEAMNPGATESFFNSIGMGGTANLTRSSSRQQANGRMRDTIDALLYLATGAAYNKEQAEAQINAHMPLWSDKPETREAKRLAVIEKIKAGKSRLGNLWTPELDAAVASLGLDVPADQPETPSNPQEATPRVIEVDF